MSEKFNRFLQKLRLEKDGKRNPWPGSRQNTAPPPGPAASNLAPHAGSVASVIPPRGQGATNPPSQNIQIDNLALQEAIKQYHAGIPESDRVAFQSAGDIMERLGEMNCNHKQASVSRAVGERVQNFLGCIRGFMGSLSIFIQHSPEISSLVVGGVNCILLLALRYIEFFESLTTMLERVGVHLTYLSKYASLIFQGSPDVQKALVMAYCDILDLFLAVRGVFTDKEGQVSRLTSFKLFLRLTWKPFESEFQSIQDRFLNHIDVVMREAWVQGKITENEVSRRRRENEDKERKFEKRRKILEWLSPLDFEEVHRTQFSKRFGDTGGWFLNEDRFMEWESSVGSRLLWCHGMPGAGKTVLLSLVLETLAARYQLATNVGIAFAYCNYRDPQDPATYVQVFIKQLCRSRGDIPSELEQLYDKHTSNISKPSYTELQQAFISTVGSFDKVFILMDALDECQPNKRGDLFSFFRNIFSHTNSPEVGVFVTSRRIQDIEDGFRNFPTIEIAAKKSAPDIEAYITACLGTPMADGTFMKPNIKEKVLNALLSKAGGMFLWVNFQLQDIRAETSDRGIEKALSRLPESMDETYDRIILSIDQQPKPRRDLAKKVLMWLAYSTKPMTLHELAEAVAVDPDTRTWSELRSSMVNDNEALVAVCANLVTLTVNQHRYIESPIVRFVHYSVQEYLVDPPHDVCTPGRGVGVVSGYKLEALVAHAELGRVCIQYLLGCGQVPDGLGGSEDEGDSLSGSDPEDLKAESSPKSGCCNFCENLDERAEYGTLFGYANSSWMYHIRHLTTIDDHLSHLLLRFFEYGCGFWVSGTGTEGRWLDLHFHTSHQLQSKCSLATTALIFDLPALPFLLINKADILSNVPDGSLAIHYASQSNSTTAVKHLLDQGFDVGALDMMGSTPLHYAGGQEVSRFLLESGANINSTNTLGYTPLISSIRNNNYAVVKFLLDSGADVTLQSSQSRTALDVAFTEKLEEVVWLLLESPSAIPEGPKGWYWGQALSTAAAHMDLTMARILLHRGVDVDACDHLGSTALCNAASRGYFHIVLLLLDWGAAIELGDSVGQRPLHHAASNPDLRTLQLLLEYGADIGALDNRGRAALHFASSPRIAAQLLNAGADIGALDVKMQSPLHAASRFSDKMVHRSLLEMGAEVNAVDLGGQLPLHKAAKRCHVEGVRTLLEWGADVNAPDKQARTSLHRVIGINWTIDDRECNEEKIVAIVGLLLGSNADVNLMDMYGRTALHIAAALGRSRVAKLLLDRGADGNAQDRKGRTPLHYAGIGQYSPPAVKPERGAVVRLLQNNGADLNMLDGSHRAALFYALSRKSTNVARELLAQGASVDPECSRVATLGGGRISQLLQEYTKEEGR